jgi:hypothetical protein
MSKKQDDKEDTEHDNDRDKEKLEEGDAAEERETTNHVF